MSSLQITFGRYVLVERLARGGMAEIFLAKARGEAGFEKTCVVKRVLPHLAADPSFVGMFLDEARLAARLNHPGIVQVFDLGREGEDYFFAMEYLAGEDVAAVLAQSDQQHKHLPVAIVLRIIAAAAEALHYAHELTTETGERLGIVHRDVSPSNLFVTYSGTVKVLDFGVAHTISKVQRTEVGMVKGKTPYMAPEQLRGGRMDARADVWSLGVCMYELLVGERPFLGGSTPEIALAVCEAPVPSSRDVRQDIPDAVEALIRAALTRPVAERIPSALALAEQCKACLRGLEGSAPELAQFMAGLFSAEHREERLMRIRRLDSPERPGTEPLENPARGVRPERVPSALATTFVRPRKRRRIWVAAWVLLVVVAGGVSAAAFLDRARLLRSVAPPPPVARSAPLPTPTPTPTPDGPVAVPLLPEPEGSPEPTPDPPPPPPVHVRPRSTGKLVLSANVPVRGFLDGQRLGSLPTRVDAKPGRHTLRLSNPDLVLERVEVVDIKAGAETARRVSLGKGKLTVDATPWADVFLDGAKLGQTPLAGRQLWEGPHVVRLVGPHGERTLRIQVRPGETRVVNEVLAP